MAGGPFAKAFLLRPFLAMLGFIILFTALPCLQSDAFAQELIRRQTLFDRLFGGPPPREALPPMRERQRATPQRRAPSRQAQPPSTSRRQQPARSASPSAPKAPITPAVEKLENARVVLIVGDFLASGLAEGLNAAYAESPGVRIVDRSNGSSGFVRDDYYDWNAEIGPILNEVEPSVVVVMIGSNDRQQLVIDGQRESPQSDAWLKEYTRRTAAFAEAVKEAGVPLVWTGLPPFKSSSMSSDMLVFNDIHKQAAESVGGTFVDIWEGFVDENGAFAFTGPDMNGQPVRLRGSEGINLTRPGKRKVAFYVEKPLSKLLGAAVAPDVKRLDIENLPAPGELSEQPSETGRTGPVSLTGPELDGGSELLGAEERSSDTETAQKIPAAQPGRADHFRLHPRPQPPPTADEPESAAGTP